MAIVRIDAMKIDYTNIKAVKQLCAALNKGVPIADQAIVTKHPDRDNYNIEFKSRANPKHIVK